MASMHPDTSFRDLQLPPPLLAALDAVGYESPTPIQAQAIPPLLQGLDLLGHAPTGTGKTAAFALPLLARIDLAVQHIQILVLTPTRELAIQVAEAFQRYASHMPAFHVLPVYGGQDYSVQIRQLRRGVHAIVGTPGRIMDHMRKGTLILDHLQVLVLDEADEMLRMGFIEDVEWILEQAPKQRQMALFSATMPPEVERIARHHLHDPQQVTIETRTATAENIRQRYWLIGNMQKLDALTRILEVEPFEAILMFVRTKIATTELAERLEARGYAAAALNGDMVQKQREQVVRRLKDGSLDIVVATDVAARGLDVERISHVINYDIPYDIEAYIHRIGRTGRAGRSGDAILFVAPREQRMLAAIEKATRQKIELLELPTTEAVNAKRISDFKTSISDTLAAGGFEFLQGLVQQYQQENEVSMAEIAAALAKMFIGDKALLLKPDPPRQSRAATDRHAGERPGDRRSADRSFAPKSAAAHEKKGPRERKGGSVPGEGMERYRIEVGHEHGVKPGNIVGAIANEAGLDSKYIGHIDIQSHYSTVDMPTDMPQEIFDDLQQARVCGRRMNLSRLPKTEGDHRPSMPPAAPKGPKTSRPSKPAHATGKKPTPKKPKPRPGDKKKAKKKKNP